MKFKTIKLTKEESEVLINFIDCGVKARGLESANAAIILASKIQNAKLEEEVEVETEGGT